MASMKRKRNADIDDTDNPVTKRNTAEYDPIYDFSDSKYQSDPEERGIDRNEVCKKLGVFLKSAFFNEHPTFILTKINKKLHEIEHDKPEERRKLDELNAVLLQTIFKQIDVITKKGALSRNNLTFGSTFQESELKEIAVAFAYFITVIIHMEGIQVIETLSDASNIEFLVLRFAEYLSNHHDSNARFHLSKAIKARFDNRKRRRLLQKTVDSYCYKVVKAIMIMDAIPMTMIYHRRINNRSFYGIKGLQIPAVNTYELATGTYALTYRDISEFFDHLYKKEHEKDWYMVGKIPFQPKDRIGKVTKMVDNDDQEGFMLFNDYKHALILFVLRVTGLRASQVFGTYADPKRGVLKLKDVKITQLGRDYFEVELKIQRFKEKGRNYCGSESFTFYSSNERNDPAKMMIVWFGLRDAFEDDFQSCMTKGVFNIKDSKKEEILFPTATKWDTILTSCNEYRTPTRAIEKLCLEMKIPKYALANNSPRKGYACEILCNLLKRNPNATYKEMSAAIKSSPCWDSEIGLDYCKSPTNNAKSIRDNFNRKRRTSILQGLPEPEPEESVPSILAICRNVDSSKLSGENFDKAVKQRYNERYRNQDIQTMKAELKFLKNEQQKGDIDFTKVRIECLEKLVAAHSTERRNDVFEQELLIRNEVLRKMLNGVNGTSGQLPKYTKTGVLDLHKIAQYPFNKMDHCNLNEIAIYKLKDGSVPCPVDGCDVDHMVDEEHIKSHKTFGCKYCYEKCNKWLETHDQLRAKDRGFTPYRTYKDFRVHYTKMHELTHYCLNCGTVRSKSAGNGGVGTGGCCNCKFVVQLKYIKLFYKNANNSLMPCGCTPGDCMADNENIRKLLHVQFLNVASRTLYPSGDFEQNYVSLLQTTFLKLASTHFAKRPLRPCLTALFRAKIGKYAEECLNNNGQVN